MPPEGGVHERPNDKCAKMCRRYVGSAIWRRSVKKKSGKNLQGKNYRGGCSNPLGCIRVNIVFNFVSLRLQEQLDRFQQYFRETSGFWNTSDDRNVGFLNLRLWGHEGKNIKLELDTSMHVNNSNYGLHYLEMVLGQFVILIASFHFLLRIFLHTAYPCSSDY